MWAYYDFDANWQEFLGVWKTPEVQYALALDIEIWKPLGYFKNYRPGDDLWKYTKTLYWNLKAMNMANEIAKRDRPKLNKVMMHQFGFTVQYNIKATYETCFPQSNTIHAFMMPEAELILKHSLLECANKLLGGAIMTSEYILIPSKKIVFDLIGYYQYKYDKNMSYDLSKKII